MLSDTNARLASARRLTSRRERRETGRFLAEGVQAVREALRNPDQVVEVFVTAEALDRNAALLDGVEVSEISAKAAAALSETVTPQGLVAVCRRPGITGDDVLARSPRLSVVLVEPNDPANVGAIIRTADAAGADAVIVDGGSDPFGGKAVRASVGSIFHIAVAECAAEDWFAAATAAGVTVLATSGRGDRTLDELIDDDTLARPSVWVFGNEAHGLPDSVLERADRVVRVPIYGAAESLNLAAAAAVCLYASARAQRPGRR